MDKENARSKKEFPILLVDDEKDYRDAMALWLKTEGYLVEIASSGEEAVDIIKRDWKKIVFLDVKMPGMGGVEALRSIRAFNREVPVIMLTAHADEEKIKECKELGISGFFPKGDDFSTAAYLISTVLRILKRKISKE